MNKIKLIGIDETSIIIQDNNTLTILPGGKSIPASPQDNDEYRARAKSLGYGDDTGRMSREHEILHTLLSHWLGLPESPTMRGLVSKKHYEHWNLEEAAVLAIAAFANAAGANIEEIARRIYEQS